MRVPTSAPERSGRLGVWMVLLGALAWAVALPVCGQEVSEGSVVAALEEAEPSFDALDGLVSLLNGPNDDAAYWAATLIGRLGDQAAPAAEQLGALVGGEASQAVRQRAAWALEKIGPSASCVLPALRSATESEDPRLARQARRAIDAIGVP